MQTKEYAEKEVSMFHTDLGLEGVRRTLEELGVVVRRRITIYRYSISEVLGQEDLFVREFVEQVRRNTEAAFTGLKKIVSLLEEFRFEIAVEAIHVVQHTLRRILCRSATSITLW